MTEGGLQLTEAQRAGIERTDLSMALTSGAGCGKTFVLVRRYLKVLLDDGRPDAPARAVAVTFTDKAAIEMRQRVGELLARRIAEADDPAAKALMAEWLSRLPDARISTIHGFCASLLRTYAVEAGVDPAFIVLGDEFIQRRLLKDAVDHAAREAFTDPDDRQRNLLDSFPYNQIETMLVEAVRERWRWDAADHADPDATLKRWEDLRREACDAAWADLSADAAVRAAVVDLAAEADAATEDKLALHLAEQLPLMSCLLDDPDARTPKTMKQLASAGSKGGAAYWGSKEAVRAVRDRFRPLLERFRAMAVYCEPLGEADASAAHGLAALSSLAAEAVRRYAAAKRRVGGLDYDDLLIVTRDLLARDAAIRRRVAAGIGQLLIDEFQDTDGLQHELLYLAVDCVDGSPPPGRVFFVGDAKQSIYRFRGAEVEVFEAARAAIAPEGRQGLDLNFRTHAPGLALVNRIFAPLMGPTYEPLRAHRTDRPTAAAAEFLLVESADNADARVRGTARAMAARIAEMVGRGERLVWDGAIGGRRPVRFGDIAVLLPRFQNTAPYEDALRDAGVEHYVVSGTGLFRQQEVYDLCNALRAIDNPLDDIAVIGFLRGGMVGLDDNVLAHIAAAVRPPYRPRLHDPAVLARLAEGDRAALVVAAETLERLARLKDACGVDEVIERLLASTGFEATLLGQYGGRRKCGNVHRVLAHARQAADAGATLSEFAEFLSELTVEEIRAEQAATDPEGGDVVRLMTIHKAKGLEFPVVFLPDLNYEGRDNAPPLTIRGRWGLTLRTQDDDGRDSLAWRLARRAEQAADADEDRRAFYVAVTRHQDYVVFAGALQQVGERLGKANSALRMLDEALGLAEAVEAGRVDLGDGAEAVVRVVAPRATRAEVSVSVLDGLCARCDGPDALAVALAPTDAPAPPTPPYLASVDAATGERIGVTALATLAWCPACYKWSHELRVPADTLAALGPRGGADGTNRDGLDAATAGTVFHRCMELLDFHHPQSPAALVDLALTDLNVTADPAPLADDLAEMLSALAASDLWTMLATASRRLKELAFTTRLGRLHVEGVIDLLAADTAGRWHIIDYKSDRLAAADVATHAGRYALQMHIYAAAAARHLRIDGADEGIDATLYFLRPAVTHTFTPAELTEAAAERRVAGLADLLAECRRSGRWPGRADAACGTCRYAPLCADESRGTVRSGAV